MTMPGSSQQQIVAADGAGMARSSSKPTNPYVAKKRPPVKEPNESDDDDVESRPPRKSLPVLSIEAPPCCECTKFSTCSRTNQGNGKGCECRKANRKCINCRCRDGCCTNRLPPLPTGTTVRPHQRTRKCNQGIFKFYI